MNFKRVALLVAALAMISAAGCGKLAEKASEKAAEKVVEQACKDGAEGEDCEVDISKDGATMKLDDGSEMSFGENVDYPEGYPDYLKLDGFAPMQATQTAGEVGFVVTLANPDGGTADSAAALAGQAKEAGCTPDENVPDIAAETMGMLWLNCPDGHVSITPTEGRESEQVLSVMLTAEE